MSPRVVAYALDKYHQPSQTFIDLEIAYLRRAGLTVHVRPLRRGSVDRSDQDPELRYLDGEAGSRLELLREHLQWWRNPLRYLAFLRLMLVYRSEIGRSTDRLVRWWRVPGAAADLRRHGVEHVHCHFSWSAVWAASLATLLDVPWSMTLHARDIFVWPANLSRKVRLADSVITVCEYNARWLQENAGAEPLPAVLTCGIEPVAAVTATPEVDVVLVARLVEKKAVDVLLRAVAQLFESGRTVVVDIIGDGPLRHDLEALASQSGAPVRFLGEQPHDVALARMSRARVLAMPCRVALDGDRDAMPTVIIEAMMRGIPVVACAVGGVPEMLDDTCGRVVPVEDVPAFAASLAELLDDEELRGRLGAAAAVRARECYDVAVQVRRLAALFDDAARSRSARRSA